MEKKKAPAVVSDINVTPMVDVMLVLLIIFMVTAPLITPSVINLPTVDRANKQPDKPIEIVIKSDDEVQIKKDPSTGSGGSSIPMTQIGSAAKTAQGGYAQPLVGDEVVDEMQVRNSIERNDVAVAEA